MCGSPGVGTFFDICIAAATVKVMLSSAPCFVHENKHRSQHQHHSTKKETEVGIQSTCPCNLLPTHGGLEPES